MGKSIKTQLKDLAPSERADVIAKLPEHLVRDMANDPWWFTARPEQLPPEGDWKTWMVLAGRGFGKTRTAAEWLAAQAIANPNTRWAIAAPTFTDARDTCAEGESGVINILRLQNVLKDYNRSIGEILLTNGSRIKLFSGEEPNRFRGPQHHGGWFDELAAFKYPEAWEQYQYGLRLGAAPRSVITTTPRPTAIIRKLLNDPSVVITRGSTFDNEDNLPTDYIDQMRANHEGTRMGRQELYGEVLTDIEGALWTEANVEETRVDEAPEMRRIVVAIDPSGGSSKESDEQGIVVAGEGHDGQFYVLADRTCKLSPMGWATVAIQAYREFGADRIVAEKNFGGEMVESTIRSVDQNVPIKLVNASRGKALRAEPIAALYEQKRVHHVGAFTKLEAQMTQWSPTSGVSPDRMDALVWAITELSAGGNASAWINYLQQQTPDTGAATSETSPDALQQARNAAFRAASNNKIGSQPWA